MAPAISRVLGLGDRPQGRTVRHQVQRGGQVVDDGDPGQHRRHRPLQPGRCVDQADCPAGPVGQRSGILPLRGRPVREDDRRPPAVGILERLHRRAGRSEAVGSHRVGGGPQHRRQRGLIPRVDPDEFCHGAEEACAATMFNQPGRAVLAFQAHRERVDASLQ
jgi:hypothetical protein